MQLRRNFDLERDQALRTQRNFRASASSAGNVCYQATEIDLGATRLEGPPLKPPLKPHARFDRIGAISQPSRQDVQTRLTYSIARNHRGLRRTRLLR